MPVIMLMMKVDRWNSSPTSVAIPSPTTIESSAMSIGISPATTAPNTSKRTTIEIGRPKSSSPFRRSLVDKLVKSLPTVWTPVTATENPPLPFADSTALTTGFMSASVAAFSEIKAAWRLGDSGLPEPRSATTSVMPGLVPTFAWSLPTNALKSGSAAVDLLELTTMTSVGLWPADRTTSL